MASEAGLQELGLALQEPTANDADRPCSEALLRCERVSLGEASPPSAVPPGAVLMEDPQPLHSLEAHLGLLSGPPSLSPPSLPVSLSLSVRP